MGKQVAVVTIGPSGVHHAVFLEGQLILSVNQDECDLYSVVETSSSALARIHGVDVEYINVDMAFDGDWEPIQDALIESGELAGGMESFEIEYTYTNKFGVMYDDVFTVKAENFEEAVKSLIDKYSSPNSLGEELIAHSTRPLKKSS